MKKKIFFWLQGMWDLNFPHQGLNLKPPTLQRQHLIRWTTEEVLYFLLDYPHSRQEQSFLWLSFLLEFSLETALFSQLLTSGTGFSLSYFSPNLDFLSLFFFFSINYFYCDCTGSSWLHVGCLLLQRAGATQCFCEWTAHCSGFSYCGPQALGMWA